MAGPELQGRNLVVLKEHQRSLKDRGVQIMEQDPCKGNKGEGGDPQQDTQIPDGILWNHQWEKEQRQSECEQDGI